jgi:hypothetical protein
MALAMFLDEEDIGSGNLGFACGKVWETRILSKQFALRTAFTRNRSFNQAV